MRRTIYTVIFCIFFHSEISHQDSELIGDSIDEETKKISHQDSELIGDSIDEETKKISHQDSELMRDSIDEETKKTKTNDKDVPEAKIGMDNKMYFSTDEVEKLKKAGDAADLFGTNQHYNIPVNYPDIFGMRRFVLTYPYVQKNIANDAAEAELDNIVKKYLDLKKTSSKEKEIRLVKAPPEFVLQIAKQSALLEASKPIISTDEFNKKDILRTGEYWDDVWKEDVDVNQILRSNSNQQNKLDSIKVKILPGSKLHTLISKLKESSPRFLYVINKNIERCCLVFFNYPHPV